MNGEDAGSMQKVLFILLEAMYPNKFELSVQDISAAAEVLDRMIAALPVKK